MGIGVPIVVVGVLLWQLAKYGNEVGRRSQCCANLKMIAIAMLTYSDAHGCFPPAYIPDKEGRPMHSWRVLLMPFMGEEHFFESYRLDEPWNSPHNRALAHGVPHGMDPNYPIYHCPSDRDSDKWDTSYVMVVGPRAISDGPTAMRPEERAYDFSRTVVLIEMSDSGIPWMEPRDLRSDEMSFKINSPDGRGIRSRHPTGAMVMFGHANERFLHETEDPRLVEDLIAGRKSQAVADFFNRPLWDSPPDQRR